MKIKDVDQEVAEKSNPYSDSGNDLANRENSATDPLEDLYDSPSRQDSDRNTIKDQEESATHQANNSSQKYAPRRAVFKGFIKGKTSLITLIFVLIGGGTMSMFFASPFLAPIMMKETLVRDLDDQLKAFDNSTNALLRSKLKTTTNGSCGVVKVACRFATVSSNLADNFKRAGIELDLDKSVGIGKNRGQITRMTFTDPSNGQKTYITNAAELQNHLKNNMAFRAAMITAYNPNFMSKRDKTAMNVYKKFKTNLSQKITGNTDEERKNSINAAVEGRAPPDTKNLTPVTDKDGKPTGEYTDSSNVVYSQAEVDAAQESANRISLLAKIGSSKVVQAAAKGAMITGIIDSACTVYNTSRAVAALSKIKKKEQAGRYAMMMVLTPADSAKANEATEGVMTLVGDTLTATTMEKESVDETKWSENGTQAAPPIAANPDYGKNAFDSPGFRTAAYGDAPELNTRAQRFAIGGGLVGTLDSINQAIAFVVNGGNPDPKQVGAKCKLVQNPAVRLGSLAIGILAGAGSAGLSTAVTVAGSMALAMALPFLESQLADMIAGNLFKDIEGIDSGDAAFVGTAGLMGDMAQSRGLKPLNAEEAVAYTAMNQETNEKYAEVERYMAHSTPLDVTNQYSFIGSIARSTMPYIQQGSSSVGVVATNMASIIPAAFSFGTTAKAATTDRFQRCNDPNYEAIGIDADVFCNVRYGLSKKEMAIDPIENANWMAQTGNIDPNDENGAAKDNKQAWNYVKFLRECPNRTTGWGEDQTENGGDGANCRAKDKEAVNEQYRVYTLNLSADLALDAEPLGSADEPGTTGFGSGEKGAVSTTGWAYPTTPDGVMTSGFGMRGGTMHKGVDLAQPGNALNKPIFAARDGKVIKSGPAEGFGNWIIIQHDDNGQRVDSLYGHMYNDGVLVKVGDTVKAGQQIGKIGSMGWSSGPHLHFELWRGGYGTPDGEAFDPEEILNAAKNTPPNTPGRNV